MTSTLDVWKPLFRAAASLGDSRFEGSNAVIESRQVPERICNFVLAVQNSASTARYCKNMKPFCSFLRIESILGTSRNTRKQAKGLCSAISAISPNKAV